MSRGRALVLALIVTALWSTSFILTKIALRSMGPLWLAFLRYESAGLVLALVSLPQVVGAARAVGLSRLALIAWLAVVNTAVAFTLWAESQRGLRAYESNVLSNLVLVEASLLALVFLAEPLGAPQWAGIGLVLAGVLLTELRASGPRPIVPEELEEPLT